MEIRHVVFSGDLLDVDHSQVHLFAYVVDDHKKVLAFLKVRLVAVVMVMTAELSSIMMAGSWRSR